MGHINVSPKMLPALVPNCFQLTYHLQTINPRLFRAHEAGKNLVPLAILQCNCQEITIAYQSTLVMSLDPCFARNNLIKLKDHGHAGLTPPAVLHPRWEDQRKFSPSWGAQVTSDNSPHDCRGRPKVADAEERVVLWIELTRIRHLHGSMGVTVTFAIRIVWLKVTNNPHALRPPTDFCWVVFHPWRLSLCRISVLRLYQPQGWIYNTAQPYQTFQNLGAASVLAMVYADVRL